MVHAILNGVIISLTNMRGKGKVKRQIPTKNANLDVSGEFLMSYSHISNQSIKRIFALLVDLYNYKILEMFIFLCMYLISL